MIRRTATLFLTIGSALSAISSFAQPAKGSLFIGGSINLSQTSNKVFADTGLLSEQSNFALMASPRAGIYVAKNWAIGLSLGIGGGKQSNIQSNTGTRLQNDTKDYQFGASVFARYHYFLGSHFALFSDIAGSYRHSISRSETNGKPSFAGRFRGNEAGLNLVPGVLVFPNARVSLEASFGRLGYNYSVVKPESSNIVAKSETQSLALNLSASTLTIGINYYLPPRRRTK